MSGLETLGALASTAQIALYVMRAVVFINEIYERVKHAPAKIRQHAHHIQHLLEIVRHIQQMNPQNSAALFNQLKSTISQACNLRDLLDKVLGQYTNPSFRSRYWKLLKGSKEKEILAALQSLERGKTGLTLYLAASNTELLQAVRRDLGGIQHTEAAGQLRRKGSQFGRTTKERATLIHLITNEDMECNGGFQHGGLAGKLRQEGPHSFKIENKRGRTTGSGVANWGIVLEGGENLFDKFVRKETVSQS